MNESTPAAPDEPPAPIGAYRMMAPNIPQTVKVARDMVAALLHATNHPELADVARLLVSEVVTNVHAHTKVPRLALDATVHGNHILVSITDRDPHGVPEIRKAILSEESGRGLPLVQHFATAWGTTTFGGLNPTSKSVWFELRDEPNSQ